QVPPGLSGAEQYVETTPTVTGGKPTSDHRGGGGPTPEAALGKENAQKLEGLGADGASTARLAAQGAPAQTPSGQGGRPAAGPPGVARRGPPGGPAPRDQRLRRDGRPAPASDRERADRGDRLRDRAAPGWAPLAAGWLTPPRRGSWTSSVRTSPGPS